MGVMATTPLLLLATVAVAIALATRRPHKDLPAECADFTAGLCNTNADDMLDSFPGLPDGPYAIAVCQELCQAAAAEDCRYFTFNAAQETCYLFRYRYLDSCEVIGGLAEPTLAECHAAVEDSCDSFKREECSFSGNVVFNRSSVADAAACQQLLGTVGSGEGAVYFVYNSLRQECVMYDSKEGECDAFSGPALPDMADCNQD